MTEDEGARRASAPPAVLRLALRDVTVAELEKLRDLGFGEIGEIAALWLYRWTTGRVDPQVHTIADGPRVAVDVAVEQVTLEKLEQADQRAGVDLISFCTWIVDRYAGVFIRQREQGMNV